MAIRTCQFCDEVHDASEFCPEWDIIGCPACDTKHNTLQREGWLIRKLK